MKKSYIAPALQQIQLSMETGILAASGHQNHFDLGISNDAMNGSEALSNRKDEMWDTEDIWN